MTIPSSLCQSAADPRGRKESDEITSRRAKDGRWSAESTGEDRETHGSLGQVSEYGDRAQPLPQCQSNQEYRQCLTADRYGRKWERNRDLGGQSDEAAARQDENDFVGSRNGAGSSRRVSIRERPGRTKGRRQSRHGWQSSHAEHRRQGARTSIRPWALQSLRRDLPGLGHPLEGGLDRGAHGPQQMHPKGSAQVRSVMSEHCGTCPRTVRFRHRVALGWVRDPPAQGRCHHEYPT